MKGWLWIASTVLAALWSLLAWGTYALVDAAGSLVAGNADWTIGHPETVVWLSWLANFATSLGLIGVVAVWAFGLVAIAIVPPLLYWFLGRRQPARRPLW